MSLPNARPIAAAATTALLAPLATAENVYEATFQGTFTSVEFRGADPGRFGELGPGDAYLLRITTSISPRTLPTGDVVYDALSLELVIADGVTAPFDATPGDPGFITTAHVPDSAYFFGLSYGLDDGPFNRDVAIALLDDDGDPVRADTDLPLDLDLDAFSGGRALRLTGFLDAPTRGFADPLALATVDTFSARIIPTPAGGVLATLGLALTRRRRRPAST